MSEWMWFVVHQSDDLTWTTSNPFAHNRAAWEEAKRLAREFPTMKFFVAETSHVATVSNVEFREIAKTR